MSLEDREAVGDIILNKVSTYAVTTPIFEHFFIKNAVCTHVETVCLLTKNSPKQSKINQIMPVLIKNQVFKIK